MVNALCIAGGSSVTHPVFVCVRKTCVAENNYIAREILAMPPD